MNLQHAKNAIEVLRIIRPVSDIPNYLKYRNKTDRPLSERSFRVRTMPDHPFLCRPNTTDARVLQDTFAGRFHLPHVPLPQNATILDLGANVGFVAADFARAYPTSRVISVELDHGNAEQARRNTASFGSRIKLIEAAIWKENGTVFYGGEQEWGFRIDPNVRVDANTPLPPGVRKARAVSIETLLDEEGINTVDYMKMDIEGAEGDVLKTIKSWGHRVRSIKVEVHKPITTTEVEGILQAAGFKTGLDKRHWALVLGWK